jgi:probable rRNA maturation factor
MRKVAVPLTGIDNDEAPYLGDIAISVPMAKRQAKAGGHSLKSELQLLTVHGTLHLLGYDHEEAEEKKLMWAAQSSILAQVGAEITSPE